MNTRAIIYFGLSIISAIAVIYIYIKSFHIQELLVLIFAIAVVLFFILGRKEMREKRGIKPSE